MKILKLDRIREALASPALIQEGISTKKS